jgi:DNA modification methylase
MTKVGVVAQMPVLHSSEASPLTESDKSELMRLLSAGEPLAEHWRHRLFRNNERPQETGKEYRLVYDGKLKREDVLAQTPAAPWQLVREFCAERPHADGWRNLLVWGDNLLAMRELLADQQGQDRFRTRGKIKLIYIDPPFATRQDFMKDKEKAYRDKVLGAQFIEFLRRRLILLRELLADDGSLYVHLDVKKSHYLKAVLDEVFGEENFQNEIVWKRTSARSDSHTFNHIHDILFFYSKTPTFRFNEQFLFHDPSYIERYFTYTEPNGRRFATIDATQAGLRKGSSGMAWRGFSPSDKGNHWKFATSELDRLDSEKRIYWPAKDRGWPRLKAYLDEQKGVAIQSIWTDIKVVNSQAVERLDYPTQKPEQLVERVIRSSSSVGDIVLDCFVGSGTTAAVAEKLGRRWIAMDCGKLAICTTQKRLFCLNTVVGSAKKDDRSEPERVEDWTEHLKGAPGILLITEKARKGECEVTLDLVHDLAGLAKKHQLLKKGAAFSFVCPEEKLRIPENRLENPEEGPGTKRITVDGVEFRISVIAPKDKTEKEQQLPANEFALYRAGVYDMAAIRELPWEDYRPFVLKLFGVREHSHARYGFSLDGYIGTNSTVIWNYPEHRALTLDYGYVDDLHRTLRGKPGERFYVIAPVVAMAFAEDEVRRVETTYVFLKVPLSILLRLIERKEPAAFKQPSKEAEVNEVIDAAGFDFISQPKVIWRVRKRRVKEQLFDEYVLEIAEFRAQTLATDPEDFRNFETFSMAMVDLDYNGDVFRLSRVFWAEDVLNAMGGLEKAELLELCIREEEFTGRQMMIVLCDRYGNEKSLLLKREDFGANRPRPPKKLAKKARKAK